MFFAILTHIRTKDLISATTMPTILLILSMLVPIFNV